VRWLLKRGIPSEQARLWREDREQGLLVLPAGADLAQARRTWERPQLSPERKRDRINEYVAVLSQGGQASAERWLRDQHLTWWELEDWYSEPGVVPDQDRGAIAWVFDGPAAQATAPAIPAERIENDAGQAETDPTPAEGPMPAQQMPASPGPSPAEWTLGLAT
jgi:hypothetical protein